MDTTCAVVVKGELVAGQSGPPSPGKACPSYWDEVAWAERLKALQGQKEWATNFRTVVIDGEVLMSEAELMKTRCALANELEFNGGDTEVNDYINPLAQTGDYINSRDDARKLFRHDIDMQYGVCERPTYKDTQCVCLWCGNLFSVHSTRLMCHIAFECCSDHPQKDSMHGAVARTATAKMFTAKLARRAALADEDENDWQ